MLVFDNLGRDIISSVLRVQDLRNFGVTIHLYVSYHGVLVPLVCTRGDSIENRPGLEVTRETDALEEIYKFNS